MISTLLCIVIFSVFSTAVMSYVTMATPIGPWMGPILAVGILLLRRVSKNMFTSETMLLSVVSGSLGGILATAFGFSFPTFYFLDKSVFIAWAQVPSVFIPAVSLLALSSGLLGLWVASESAQQLLYEQKLAFPIGALVYKITSSVDDNGRLRQLVVGFVGTLSYCLLLLTSWFKNYVPAVFSLTRSFSLGPLTIPAVQFIMGQIPLLWSIGFVAGSMITMPLLLGTLSKIFIVDLINKWCFPTISIADFLFAFCSGMVLFGAVSSLFLMPAQFIKLLKKFFSKKIVSLVPCGGREDFFKALFVIGLSWYTLAYFDFSFLSIFYVIFFSGVCAYQIAAIAGKIGLALLGRFATFVMIPGMIIFGLNSLQVTVLATFVEACGGITTDALFGRKACMDAGVDQKKVVHYQLFGLIISSITLGIMIWFLVTHFELGSELLFAERAQGRALLINATHFNCYVLLCGVFYGSILKRFGCNPMLVLGGLLMPLSLTIGLMLGGVTALLLGKKYDIEPFCSGMFAANSVGMILQALLNK